MVSLSAARESFISRSDKQDPPARRPLRPFVADLCAAPEGHRMELSGGRVLGLQPASRKSWTALHCRSKQPLRVQCDGQLEPQHTLALCVGDLGLSHTHMHTHSFGDTSVFFAPLSSLYPCGRPSLHPKP